MSKLQLITLNTSLNVLQEQFPYWSLSNENSKAKVHSAYPFYMKRSNIMIAIITICPTVMRITNANKDWSVDSYTAQTDVPKFPFVRKQDVISPIITRGLAWEEGSLHYPQDCST